MDSASIIQWNMQGIRNKKDELSELISAYKANIIAVQETKLWNNTKFNIPCYSEVRQDGHYNMGPHGGVAIYIHSSIPFNSLNVNTPIQTVVIRAQLHTPVTICNIYSSRAHPLNQQLLTDLYNQLPQPCIIIGDFNAHNILWGSEVTDARGRQVEVFIEQHNLSLMNNGAPTRILYDQESAIDLSLCSPQLSADLLWTVLSSPGDSDHCPIVISYQEAREIDTSERWKVKSARWDIYEKSDAWRNLPQIRQVANTELIDDLYDRINAAAKEAIPQSIYSKYFPKPWWNDELKNSKERRETFYQQYRRNKTQTNLIIWRRSRAQHKQLVKKCKRESWMEFVEKLNRKTPSTALYETIRKIKGKPTRKINILSENGQTYSTVPEIVNRLAQTFSDVSSNANYSPEFQTHKAAKERLALDFSSDNTEPYNKLFTITDLEYNLAKVKNTTPGKDSIHYQMIKHMPENAKEHLCKLFNKFFEESFFPEQWRSAIVIPVPKPGKSHSVSTNYRPIALTSCLCKTFERMVNERLVEYLEMHGVYSQVFSVAAEEKGAH